MSNRRKTIVISVCAAVFVLLAAALLPRFLPPEGAVMRRDIVSFCAGDATGDGVPEFLVVSGGGKTDAGDRHGQFLLACDASAEESLDRLGYIPPDKIRFRFDLADIKPMKVQLGDINGDGLSEVAVCVYKATKFYPDLEKRPFFFDLEDGGLVPVWLGSRLSRPFDDYILYDIDGGGTDELISVEALEDGGRVLAAYGWKGFGFELRAQSEAFDGALRFDADADGREAGPGEIRVIFSRNKEQTALTFRLNNDKLIDALYD